MESRSRLQRLLQPTDAGAGNFRRCRPGPAGQAVAPPQVDARALPAWGAYVRNVEHFTLEDVRFSLAQDDVRPVVFAEQVVRLTLDSVRFPRVAGVANPVVTTKVGTLELRQMEDH